MSTSTKKSMFWTLPRELRDDIYTRSYARRRLEIHQEWIGGWLCDPDKYKTRLLITRIMVCKHFYVEAADTLYSQTNFVFAQPAGLSTFLRLTNKRNLRSVRSIAVRMNQLNVGRPNAFDLLAECCPQLRTLILLSSQHRYLSDPTISLSGSCGWHDIEIARSSYLQAICKIESLQKSEIDALRCWSCSDEVRVGDPCQHVATRLAREVMAAVKRSKDGPGVQHVQAAG